MTATEPLATDSPADDTSAGDHPSGRIVAIAGHPGAPMGMADMAVGLWTKHLKHNPANPKWLDRDRFVLSNGHGSMLIYALLHLTGYKLPMSELKNFRQLHSKTAGHPEVGVTPGIETTTGPLGQGITNAVGMALAEKLLAKDFDYYEIHEAFAATVLATLAAWESGDYCRDVLGLATPLGSIDRARLNVNGSSLAAGHPFAATGGRIVATLAKLLHARGRVEGRPARGLISVCAAGGQGVVAILEAM